MDKTVVVSHTITITVSDKAGNESTKEVTQELVDTTAPVISINNSLAYAYGSVLDDVRVEEVTPTKWEIR